MAFDHAQNHSSASNSVNPTTSSAGSDTTAPTVPTGLAVSLLTRNSVRVSWNPSLDVSGTGIQGYKVYRDSVLVSGSTPITATYFEQTGLSYTTTYAYKVEAVDNANNVSAQTSAVNITTDRQLLWSDNFNRADASTLGTSWTYHSSYLPQVSFRLTGAGADAPAPPSGNLEYLDLMSASSATNFKLSADVTTNVQSSAYGSLFFYVQEVTYEIEPCVFVDTLRGYRVDVDAYYQQVRVSYCWDIPGGGCDNWSSASLSGVTSNVGRLSVETNASTGNLKVYWRDSLKIDMSVADIETANGGGTTEAGGAGLYAISRNISGVLHPVRFDNFQLESN